MRLRSGLNKFTRNSKLKKIVSSLVLIALVATTLSSFSFPGTVHAGGSGGSGGNGGGACGGVGPCTSDGWSWATFNVGDEGPSYLFANGTDLSNGSTSWPAIQAQCNTVNATTIYAFVIRDDSGRTGIYNYSPALSTSSGGPQITTPPPYVDVDNTGTPTSIGDAQTQFGIYQKKSGSNLNFGQNVGWFCSNYPPAASWALTPTTVASESSISSSKPNVTFTSNIKNNNNSASPAKYDWAVQFNEAGDAYSNVGGGTGSASGVNPGSSSPSNLVEPDPGGYSWATLYRDLGYPTNPTDYCQRIEVTDNSTGPSNNGGAQDGTVACVTVEPSNPQVSSWALTPTTVASEASIGPTSPNVTFTSNILNNGPDAATYDWAIKFNKAGDAYSNVGGGTGSASGVSPGSSSPNNINEPSSGGYTWTLLFDDLGKPTTPTSYCQEIEVTDNSTGPSNAGGTQYGTPACITVEPLVSTPSVPVLVGTCSDAVFTVGSGADLTKPSNSEGVWAADANTGVHYALYETANGVPPADGWTDGEDLRSPYPAAVNGAGLPSSDPISIDSYGAMSEITASSGAVAANSLQSYTLTNSQLRTGTVSWYLVTYNNGGLDTWTTSKKVGGKTVTTTHSEYTTYVSNVESSSAGNCYSASCSNLQITNAGLGADDLEGGQGFTVQASLTNDGSNGLSDPINPSLDDNLELAITYNGQTNDVDVGGYVPPGGTSNPVSTNFTSPADESEHDVTCTAIYTNWSDLGPPSGLASYDYEQFNIQPISATASLNNDEDPTQVNKSYSVQNTTQWPAPATVSEYLQYDPAGTPDFTGPIVEADSDSGSYGPGGPYEHTYNIPAGFNAGDTYCASMSISPSTGWVGPGGSTVDTTNLNNWQGGCQTISNEPYAHFLGNDAIAGGGFGASCTVASGGIYTYSHATNISNDSDSQPTGSGSQFGAEALSAIEGLSSANLRTSDPTGSMGLTFANSGVLNSGYSGGDGNATNLGGSDGTNSCYPDYYSELKSVKNTTPYNAGDSIGSNVYTAGTGPSSSTQIGAIPDLPGGSINISNGTSATIYVNGNVDITSNIVYTGATSGWAHVADIPSLYIIASGNIYVSPAVTQLDGVYVAQPNSSSGTGVFDSCASNSSLPVNYLYGQILGCNTQLTVNGSVIAQKVKLDRSFSSLRYAQAGEDVNTTGANAHNCGNLGNDVSAAYAATGTNFTDCAAEIFNFSPELYLATPNLPAVTGPTTGKFDYITSLSPVL